MPKNYCERQKILALRTELIVQDGIRRKLDTVSHINE